MKKLLYLIFPLALMACGDSNNKMANGTAGDNPAAEGFDQEGSDSLAIVWADAVMRAQGGREAWDNTRYISWNFFGNRELLWDKQTGRVRIEVPKENNIYLININDEQGRVQVAGQEITDEQERKEWIEKGKQIWVNDSYWLVMPYKLKDSGVTLTHAGKDTMPGGKEAEVLELRFEEVGFTPQNKYRVYIDPADSLVKAWAYYENAAMDTPNFRSPWQNYQQHGNILLSGDRGERQITDISVAESVDEKLFEEF
jgi:hypothetical protein